MADLRTDLLDDFSRFALPLILTRFPEWESFASINLTADNLEIRIPCPSPAVTEGLWVSTADQEMTVGFHTYHSHFTDFDRPMNPNLIEAALNQASAYLHEQRGIVTWYKGEQIVGGTCVNLPVEGDLPRMFLQYPITHGTLRSWTGRFDRDEYLDTSTR